MTSKDGTQKPRGDLVEDIKPKPTKSRSELGVVNLLLEEDTMVKAVGVVYGLEHEISNDLYSVSLFLDQYNQRLKINSYDASDLDAMVEKVEWLAAKNDFDKIICMASRNDWQRFLKHGFVLEAVLKYYHSGEDAFVMSKFGSQERLTSHCLYEEIQIIEKIMETDAADKPAAKPNGFEVRLAEKKDISGLVSLYQEIFETYPSPLLHEDYLRTIFQKENLFVVALKAEKVIAAASADLFPKKKAAELTDCATSPEARGNGIMSYLLRVLENEILKKDYLCAFTMARARSYGMNNVFYQRNYEFTGRLVNNCDIFGAYEDMNIWVKNLKVHPPGTL